MIAPKILAKLQALGTEQTRKIYKKHGGREPLFGVSFANLNKLKKSIKINHPLALELWNTSNLDAMVFATMIANPKEVTNDLLESWCKDLYCGVQADLFATLVYQTEFAQNKMEAWIESNDEWIARTGWDLLTKFAMQNKTLPDKFFSNYLNRIHKTIHSQPNFTKHAMNNALIAIGVRNNILKEMALNVAKEIGKVYVDHKETNCKTPDAANYILKTTTRRGLC